MKLQPLDQEEPIINLIPMIDVVFTLLVFFMLATTFAERERLMDIELPHASADSLRDREPQELVINVARDGGVLIDGRTLQEDELRDLLSRTAERDPKTLVTVRGDRRGYYDRIMQVLDACAQARLLDVSLEALTE